jgi:DNA-binding XRE family transcriptional regulator
MAHCHSLQGQFAMMGISTARLSNSGMSRRAAIAEDDLQASTFTAAAGRRMQMVAAVAELSQSEIARAVRVDQSTVNKWFAGKRLPSVYQVSMFCEAYGASLDFIYRGSLVGCRMELAVKLAATYPELVLGQGHPAKATDLES